MEKSKSRRSLFGYIYRDSPIHRLTGATKLIMTLLCSIASMITYDTRFLVGMLLLSGVIYRIAKIKFSDIGGIIKFIALLMVINTIAIYLFAPEEGVKIYSTRQVLFHIAGRYYIIKEQLFYMLNIILKYFAVLPMALLFITTTQPSEFAASLNKLGVNYKIAYSVSLTLRYIPDVQKDYREISQAQQARGVDISRNVGLFTRIKNSASILFPLLLSSLSRIDIISNAMELRGFGKHKKRTWYHAQPFKISDLVAVFICVLLIIIAFVLNYINKGRFYNPFI